MALSNIAINLKNVKQRIQQQIACIPHKAQPDSLHALIHRFETSRFPDWESVPVALCRLDNNILNFIRHPERWISVDWEYSGWGDPAFDIADLITHAAYVDVPSSWWDWVIETYGHFVDDSTVAFRIHVYYKIKIVWWVVRLARYLYERPQGLDQRVLTWSDNWQADRLAKYEHYFSLAKTLYGS